METMKLGTACMKVSLGDKSGTRGSGASGATGSALRGGDCRACDKLPNLRLLPRVNPKHRWGQNI